MKIKIIAMAQEDGWGIIKKDEQMFILRPPYTNSDLIEVSNKEIEKLIYIHGFEECDIPLDSLNEVITLLKRKFVEAMEKIGVGRMPSSQLRLKMAVNVLEKCSQIKKERQSN